MVCEIHRRGKLRINCDRVLQLIFLKSTDLRTCLCLPTDVLVNAISFCLGLLLLSFSPSSAFSLCRVANSVVILPALPCFSLFFSLSNLLHLSLCTFPSARHRRPISYSPPDDAGKLNAHCDFATACVGDTCTSRMVDLEKQLPLLWELKTRKASRTVYGCGSVQPPLVFGGCASYRPSKLNSGSPPFEIRGTGGVKLCSQQGEGAAGSGSHTKPKSRKRLRRKKEK